MRQLKIVFMLLYSEVVFAAFWLMFPFPIGHMITASHRLIHLHSLGEAFSYPAPGSAILLIPAILTGMTPQTYLMVIQLLLMLWGVWLFFSEFDIDPSPSRTFLLIPFIAMMSLLQTCAVPAFLLFFAVVMLRKSRYMIAAACLAACYLFRTEYLLWSLLVLIDWKGEMK